MNKLLTQRNGQMAENNSEINNILKKNERIDDLNLDGLKIIQNPSQFCFGVDAVLLAYFAAQGIKKWARVLDLCSGNGIIPILLTHKSAAEHITGLEIQSAVAEMAGRSVALNRLEAQIDIVCGDLRHGSEIFGRSSFHNITCNPPYKENGGGIKNKFDVSAIARHEIMCNLEDVIKVSAELLTPGGKLALIHRPERLADIFWHMRNNKIEPKRLRMVHPSYGKTATMVLVEGAYCGRPKLFLEPPLYIHKSDGSGYTEEIDLIYERN